MEKIQLLGVGVTKASFEAILEYIAKSLENKKEKIVIFTPNPEILVMASKDQGFKRILNSADLALSDGIGVVIGSKIVRKKVYGRVSGVDMVEKICEAVSQLNYKIRNDATGVSKQPVTTGFLGGQRGVAGLASECLRKKYPNLEVGYVSEEWDEAKVTPRVDVLFVGFGAPKQEKWIFENKNKFPATIFMSVGGSFDFLSGRVVRAPRLIRSIGLEWLFRLVIQPWRWKRQLALIEFVILIFHEFLASKKKSTS